jgi:pimeloyl-ACP methyl ester carboxylesterase
VSTPPHLRLPRVARTASLPVAGGHLAALDARPRSGPAAATVLLVPGLTGSKEDFVGLVEPLTDAGYRVLAFDQRGQFESPPAADPERYDISALAADVLDVARTVAPDRPHLLGHSFGGLVARAAVCAAPESFRSLTLLSSGPAAIPPPRAETLRLLVQALSAVDLPTIWALQEELEMETGTPRPPPEMADFLRRRFLANCPAGLLRMARQLLVEPDRVDELTRLGLPVHVAYGQYDDAWPPTEQADMARRLGAHETVLPGAMHSPAAEKPRETASALAAFWGTVERRDTSDLASA